MQLSTFEPETSTALGFGFRCGFLGLLHMEIIVERLEREFDLGCRSRPLRALFTRSCRTDGSIEMVQNPSNLPAPQEIDHIEEPMVKADIMIPNEYVGSIMEIVPGADAARCSIWNISHRRRVQLHYDMPLNEVIYDFFDALKSKTRGYGSLDYEFIELREVKGGQARHTAQQGAGRRVLHDRARVQGLCEGPFRLRKAEGDHSDASVRGADPGSHRTEGHRERDGQRHISKDVIAKCYGGDISRKKKLLEKQKEGKKRMRQFGTVEVPQEAFTAVLKYDDNK